ncbi:MAG: hypothetical protein AUI50_05200 [Crenarchaeota archaeon 13_1_40CM_2_52_14]|nr:MAG: hypothetical protein AUI97_00885 [Crenarchaeota archaeon 13_1_40CM_3_52_17]OLD34785.1 MAG: hypothetical protein AUI50_05200 [Crenarchaeota archaeon 13_1_40CM_2_52_14]
MSVLAAYSSPFVLLVAISINVILASSGLSTTPFKLILLSASFPIGFGIGKIIYMKRSNVEITFDEESFQVFKGGKILLHDNWRNYRLVSIHLDQYGRPDLRLYKTPNGDFQDLPISRTNARPQEFRDYVQTMISGRRTRESNLPVVEAC